MKRIPTILTLLLALLVPASAALAQTAAEDLTLTAECTLEDGDAVFKVINAGTQAYEVELRGAGGLGTLATATVAAGQTRYFFNLGVAHPVTVTLHYEGAQIGVKASNPAACKRDNLALTAMCTDEEGSLFRVRNESNGAITFDARAAGHGSLLDDAILAGDTDAFFYAPAGATVVLTAPDGAYNIATKASNPETCPLDTEEELMTKPLTCSIEIDKASRTAEIVVASPYRGLREIDVHISNTSLRVVAPTGMVLADYSGSDTFEAGPLFYDAYTLEVYDAGSGKVAFRAQASGPGGTVDCDPQFEPLAGASAAQPESFGLAPAFPNPFRTAADIEFDLAETSAVTLTVFDLLGRQVATLVDGQLEAGRHTARWDGRDEAGQLAASGTYLYRLEAGSFQSTRTLVLLR